MNNHILRKLAGGDRRSIGKSDEIVAEVLSRPALLEQLAGGLLSDDPIIRMRAADALEKATLEHPEYLRRFKPMLLRVATTIGQQEVRWHLAQMLPRLKLTARERKTVVAALERYLHDESSIVRTFSLQALADFAADDTELRVRVMGLLEEARNSGTPAMKSRARKLLERMRRMDRGSGR
jgi:HEAT repeat protein